MKRTEMNNIVENMAEYICDHGEFGWCRMGAGLGGFLGEDDGCSRGRKVSESDT